MPLYDVYVYCNQCGQPHSVHVQLTIEDPDLQRAKLSDIFKGDDLPESIAFMQSNNYRCPHTKQLYPAGDIDNAILILTE